MTLTLMLDLDDTLIGNHIETFVPVYSQKLGAHMAGFGAPEVVINTLWKATGQMVKNRQSDRTLEETFDAAFYPALGINKSSAKDTIDSFYLRVFPSLKEHTWAIPEAVHLVQEAFQRGYRVVIATNPLFPRTTIVQRLSWAGLDPTNLPFAIIPSFETFHYAKPDPAYYTEILARIGWPEGPVLMVGDDMQLDIQPARNAGLATFWIDKPGQEFSTETSTPTAHGSQADVLPWLDSLTESQLHPDFSSPTALIAILRATPAALDHLNRQYTKAQLTKRPSSDEWSVGEIICHLRDVDTDVHLPRVEKILQQSNPFLKGIDTDAWADERKYSTQDYRSAFRTYHDTRTELVKLLECLDLMDWQRSARHAILGPTHLTELVKIIASHDRNHIQQINKNYAE